MKAERDAVLSPSDAAAKKRWMIGLAITVLFGCFGAVMAWLNYAGHDQASPASGSKPSTSTPAPDTKDRGKGHDK